MAILEKFSTFCDNDTLTTSTGFNVEGSTLDLGKADPGDIGVGGPLYCVVSVASDIGIASSTGSIRVYLASDASSPLNGGGSTKHMIATHSTTTDLKAGEMLLVGQLPEEGADYKQHLGIVVEVLNTPLSKGAIDAYLTRTPPKHAIYADGAPALA